MTFPRWARGTMKLASFLICPVLGHGYFQPRERAPIGSVFPIPTTQITVNPRYLLELKEPSGFDIIGPDACRGEVDRYVEIWRSRKPLPINDLVVSECRVRAGFKIQIIYEECHSLRDARAREDYVINTSYDIPGIVARSQLGILNSLNTLAQMKFTHNQKTYLNETVIHDVPRFPYRALQLQTSSHFIQIAYLKRQIDAAAISKFNIIQWKIVGDKSFPLELDSYPEMAKKGSFKYPEATYSRDNVREIVNFARERGITVIPVFSSPVGTTSWGLLFRTGNCTDPEATLDVSKPSTYFAINRIIDEISDSFGTDTINLGGQSGPVDCWKASKEIQQYMQRKNIANYAELPKKYFQTLLSDRQKLRFSEELRYEKYEISEDLYWTGFRWPDTTVTVHGGHENFNSSEVRDRVHKIMSDGMDVLLAAPFYLDDHRDSGSPGQEYNLYYRALANMGDVLDHTKFKGGIAVADDTYLDETNLENRLWPQSAAVAAALWQKDTSIEPTELASRIGENFRCYLKLNGINAEPLFPGPPCDVLFH